jgi:site-specific DNA-methyltransferase (adenine-specific)
MPENFSSAQPADLPFWNEIVCGDSAVLLKLIPDNSIDLVITSPPYFQQREYDGGGLGNKKRPGDYIAALMAIFRACVRIIKPTGSIVFNVGDKYDNSSLLLMPYRFAVAAVEQCHVRTHLIMREVHTACFSYSVVRNEAKA